MSFLISARVGIKEGADSPYGPAASSPHPGQPSRSPPREAAASTVGLFRIRVRARDEAALTLALCGAGGAPKSTSSQVR